MFEAIISLVCVIFLFIALCLCIAVSDKYRSDRNVFRDKWIDAVLEFNMHLRNENYDLKGDIAELKDEIAELKKKDNDEEKENA